MARSKNVAERPELEDALRETLSDHGLRLTQVTWKKDLEKRTLALGLKVTGDLDEQLELLQGGAAPEPNGRGQ